MNAPSTGLGGRLPLADPATLTAPQRALYDSLTSTWVAYADRIGVKATTDDGHLIGPFNPFLLHPEITEKLADFQASEAANTTLAPSVREVAILLVGAVWRADYELYAQFTVARGTGLPAAATAELAAGRIPADLPTDEMLAARLVLALITDHSIGDELYQDAEQTFGATGLFDLLMVAGVYQTVCSLLALFEIPAPEPPTM